jgi:hypothetical protein
MQLMTVIGIISIVGYYFSIIHELVRKTYNPRYHLFLGLCSVLSWYDVNPVMTFIAAAGLILYTGTVLIYHHTDVFEQPNV